MKHLVGAINFEVYRNREGLFVCRVTFADPTWDWKPYTPPPQLVETTEEGRENRRDALIGADELSKMMAYKAVIAEAMRSKNV